MPDEKDIVVSEVWTRAEVVNMLKDDPFFKENPDLLTDKMISKFGWWLKDEVSEAAYRCSQNIKSIAEDILEEIEQEESAACFKP